MTNLHTSEEVFKPVIGFEGLYEISNLGNVRSLDRMVAHPRRGFTAKKKGQPLKSQVAKRGGYIIVGLQRRGKSGRKMAKVHRLVAEAFIPNPNNKPHVNHKDGDKTNNHLSNLEWATVSENGLHAYSLGLRKCNKSLGKPVLAFDLLGRFVGEYPSVREAGRQLGLHCQNICSVLKNKVHKTGGLKFKYS